MSGTAAAVINGRTPSPHHQQQQNIADPNPASQLGRFGGYFAIFFLADFQLNLLESFSEYSVLFGRMFADF